MPLALPEGSRDSGTVWLPHQHAVPPWQEAVPSGAQAKDIPLLLFPVWNRHSYLCASSSEQEGIMAFTSCASSCHDDWFITVSAAITEPSKEAAGMVTQSVLVTVPLLLTPVLCSWKEACGSISLCSLRCLGRAPPYCESQRGTAWGEEVKSSSCFPARGRTAEAVKDPPRNERVSSCSSSSSAVLPFSPLLSLCHVKTQRGAGCSQE